MYEPKFLITPSILSSIGKVEAAKAVIENSPLLPLYERQFKTEAIVRKVHYSTAIEGNYLKIDEVKKIVDGDPSKLEDSSETLSTFTDASGQELVARRRDIHEVINYREVVAFIEKLSKEKNSNKTHFKLSEDLVKKIHKILLQNIMDEAAGKYRTKNAMTINYTTGEKHYPYEDIGNFERKVRELIDWYNSSEAQEIHPIIKAGLLHLEFVRIHPFEEGNGRMARALATLSLTMDGYDVGHFFCLDEYYDSNAGEYYEYLGTGFKEPTPWLEYFCLGMAIEFTRIKERVQKISKDAKIKERAGQVFITERQEKIIEWINNFGYFQNKDFDELFPDISDDTVLRELKGLLDAKIITKSGSTKSARYVME